MNEDGQNELLIRIDERTAAMKSDMDAFKKRVNSLNCQKNSTRLDALEKVVWPSVGSGIAGFIAAVFFYFKFKGGGS